MKHYKNLVAGQPVEGVQRTVVSPWDETPVGTYEQVDYDAADQAVAHAYAAYSDHHNWLSPWQRIDILDKAQAMVAARAEELACQSAHEGGKPLADSRVELARAVDGIRAAAECVRHSAGTGIPMGITPSSVQRLAYTYPQPIGVVLAYSAFNHPFNLAVHQMAPAIAAGCPFVIKPAEETPLSCFSLLEIFHQAGLPPHYGQALYVDNNDAEKLVEDERLGFFSFIGSERVGWMLRRRLAAGVHCTLEHGGAAPVIVAEDADLDDCLPLIAKGGFYHAGQVCVSVQRVFVHASIADQFVSRLHDLAKNMKIGDPLSEETDVGPLIRHREVDRVEAWVQEAVTAGAQLVCGGQRLSDSAYACTILRDPPADSKVSSKEIFAPVVCVYSFTDIDDAIARANALPYCFQAAVISRSIDTAMHCCRHLSACTVMVNDHTAFRVDWMPFAGHKHSGYGTGGIAYTFADMQINKLLVWRSSKI